MAAKNLARHFKSITALRQAPLAELQAVEGVGEVIAGSVQTYFSKPENAALVDTLAQSGVQMAVEETHALGTSLAGQSVVVSGVFSLHSREEYKQMIEQYGGKNVSSLSKNTAFILAGENMGPSKLEKAKKLGIPVLTEAEFLERLN